jgi:hypothetical protein
VKYFLDCEFNGYRGELISLALVADDGRELYIATPRVSGRADIWVYNNVFPVLFSDGARPETVRLDSFGLRVAEFMQGDPLPTVIADWPDDIRYFCECLITGPGQMVDIPGMTFELFRVDAYPTDLEGAVQHNALWDARALRHALGRQHKWVGKK